MTLDTRALQSLLDESARALGVVGAQLAVFHRGDAAELATGVCSIDGGAPVRPDTSFQIGSTTKVFNAALIGTLVDEGVLELDTPVAHYIPRFALADADATRTVTLRHLLSMSAGIDNGSYRDYGRGDDALGAYVAALRDVPHVFEPGTAFGYSNASTNVSGHAAACATGDTWEALLSARILKPLELHHSALFAENLLYRSVALGHRCTDAGPRVIRSWALPRAAAPAGGTLCCSAGDLIRFGRTFLTEGRGWNGITVLSKEAIGTMHTPQVTLPARLMAQKWGVGPYWKRWGDCVVHGHSGTNTGGSSTLLWVPEKQAAAAVTVNVADRGYPLADRIFDVVFPDLFGVAKPSALNPQDVVPVDVDLTRYVGRFEALGVRYEFRNDAGRLVVRVANEIAAELGGDAEQESALIPLGDDRFLPEDPALGGNRAWDVAFWGSDERGRATHYLAGMFPSRRTD